MDDWDFTLVSYDFTFYLTAHGTRWPAPEDEKKAGRPSGPLRRRWTAWRPAYPPGLFTL